MRNKQKKEVILNFLKDMSEKDISEFIDQMSGEQFERIINFFNTMPRLKHTVEVVNPKTNVKNEVLLEGLQSFLG